HRERVGHRMLTIEAQQAHLILRRLREGVDRTVVAREQLDRGRTDDAEKVAGAVGDEVNFRALTLPPNIGVDAGKLRRRLEAPAVILAALRRHIDGNVALLGAELKPALHATERAALPVRLEPLPGEAILHAQVDGTAQRVETE